MAARSSSDGLMDYMSPIQGISLERYAELTAEITDFIHDEELVAKAVEAQGVSRTDWKAAHEGWLARMQDMALMGRVATAYMPLYQAALTRKRGVVDASFEDFVTLSAARKAWGGDRTNAHYGLDDASWTQIATAWTTQRIPQDVGRYGMYGMLVEQEAQRLSQGGQPRPVQIQRDRPAPVAQPRTPAAQQAYQAQQVENQMMGQAVQAQVAAAMAAAQAQSGAAYAGVGQNVGFMGRGVLGAMGMGALANGVGPGMAVLVQWSDGNRYPATCGQVANGQVQVTFGDGRQLWVPQHAVSPK